MGKPLGLTGVVLANLLQADHICVERFYGNCQIVNFKSTGWPDALNALVNVVSRYPDGVHSRVLSMTKRGNIKQASAFDAEKHRCAAA